MKTYIVPTDFSINARNALFYAIELFGSNNNFILVHSFIEPSASGASMMSIRDLMEETSDESLAEELALIKTDSRSVNANIKTESVYGEANSAIAHMATKHEAQAIVMGTTGASGLKEVFLGSVASSVLKSAKCPVIAVPANYKFKKLKHVLLTTDLKDLEKKEIPLAFLDLMKEQGAKVTVLTIKKEGEHSLHEDTDSRLEFLNQLNEVPHSFELDTNESIETGVFQYAAKHQVDMIVTRPRKSSWFERLLHPSVSKKLVQHINLPMYAMLD